MDYKKTVFTRKGIADNWMPGPVTVLPSLMKEALSLEDTEGINADLCRQHIESVYQQVLSDIRITPDDIANRSCRNRDTYFMANGFSVDLRTCNTPEAVNVIEEAANQIFDKVSCLQKINPSFGSQILSDMIMTRPTIQCGSRVPLSTVRQRACTGLSGAPLRQCNQKINPAFISGSQAFMVHGRHGQLYLGSSDPLVNPDINTSELSGVLFHEYIHICDHPGGNDHNHGNMGDEVYGCQMMCGGPEQRDYITQEGCRACVSAEENTPTETQNSFCDGLPSNAVQMKLRIAEKVNRLAGFCSDPANASHADCISMFSIFQGTTGSNACNLGRNANSRRLSECIRGINSFMIELYANVFTEDMGDIQRALAFVRQGSSISVNPEGGLSIVRANPDITQDSALTSLRQRLIEAACSQEEGQRQEKLERLTPFIGTEQVLGGGASELNCN